MMVLPQETPETARLRTPPEELLLQTAVVKYSRPALTREVNE